MVTIHQIWLATWSKHGEIVITPVSWLDHILFALEPPGAAPIREKLNVFTCPKWLMDPIGFQSQFLIDPHIPSHCLEWRGC